MQRFSIYFIIISALHVSGGFSAHHRELKNCTHSIWYVPGLLAATASGGKPPETCRALTIIKNSAKLCILLVILKRRQL
jgi:hypothetical protein